MPEVKFFHFDTLRIGECQVRALRHGMAGAPGLEIWATYSEGEQFAMRFSQRARNLVWCRSDLGLRQQHARVGLDFLTATGGLHGGDHAEVPTVVTGDEL